MPYDDNTFDIVVGHAVIHHIPDVEAAFREMLRVLKPGGRFVVAGEPTRVGDWYARRLGALTWRATKAVTHLPPLRDAWARDQEELDESSRAAALEAVVDLHTFDPDELARMALRAGAVGRAHPHGGAHGSLPRLAGADLRGRGEARCPGLGLGDVRLRLVAPAVCRRPGAGRAVPARFFYNVGITGVKPG